MGDRKRNRIYIKDWRKNAGLTQERLAELAGLSQETISRLERGQISYTQDTLEAVADALGCTVDKLVARPPNAFDELEAAMQDLGEEDRRRALAVLRALKDQPA